MIESLKVLGNPLEEPSEKRKDVYPSTFKKKDHAETLLFFGCVTSFQDIHIIPSMFQILKGAEVDFTALEAEENCCGYIAHLVGAEEDFEKCKRKNIDTILKVKPKQWVTTCAGCFRTFKELYPEGAFDGIPLLHSVQYIENLIKDGRIRFKSLPAQKVAYHDPCDLGRHLSVFDPPRNILRQIPGIELIEFESNRYNAVCCGGGGGYKAVDLEKSLEVASNRVAAAAKLGAGTIVSACPSCKSNLQVAAAKGRKEGKWKIQVKDITEFVAQALEGAQAEG
jgi:glycolate oxidase